MTSAGLIILDPSNESVPATRQLLSRPRDVAGLTVGLPDKSKPRGHVFLDRVEELPIGRGTKVLHFSKPTFTKPAPVDMRHEIAMNCNLVIEALAD